MARPRQISDEQILSAMRKHVRAEGPNVSLDPVAADLGVSVPALLKRFGNRQALMIAALKPPIPEWLATMEAGPDERPLEEQFVELFGRMMAFFAEYIPCMIALRESGISPQLYVAEKGPATTISALQKWLKRARRKGLIVATELDTAAFSILGAIQGRSFFSHYNKVPFPPSEQRAYVAQLAQLSTRALTSRSDSKSSGKNGHARIEAP